MQPARPPHASGCAGVYGERGDDRVYGGYGANLVTGGYGEDTLDGGPGADEINARDGQKDTIVIRFGEDDVVYYDKELDVLKVPVEGRGTADKVELTTERPPEGLFEPSAKVLLEHEGERVLMSEQALEGHTGHGDEILDPTGRSVEEGCN